LRNLLRTRADDVVVVLIRAK
jgi:hypothetical protein